MTVVWTDPALDQLADIYVQRPLPEQRALAQTVERINRELEDDPSSYGESREGNVRVWFTGPLVVTYRLEPGGAVRVGRVAPNRPAGR